MLFWLSTDSGLRMGILNSVLASERWTFGRFSNYSRLLWSSQTSEGIFCPYSNVHSRKFWSQSRMHHILSEKQLIAAHHILMKCFHGMLIMTLFMHNLLSKKTGWECDLWGHFGSLHSANLELLWNLVPLHGLDALWTADSLSPINKSKSKHSFSSASYLAYIDSASKLVIHSVILLSGNSTWYSHCLIQNLQGSPHYIPFRILLLFLYMASGQLISSWQPDFCIYVWAYYLRHWL